MKQRRLFCFIVALLAAIGGVMAANTTTTVARVNGQVNVDPNVDYTITGTVNVFVRTSSDYVNIPASSMEHSVIIFKNIKPSVVITNWLKNVRIDGAAAVNGTNCQVRMYNKGAIILPYASDFKPLTCYTGTGYSGTSCTDYSIGHTGGYMKTLTEANLLNNIKSFKLKRGYMVTFATGTAGWGYSRCFIAATEDLEMNLPTVLSGKVSSYRIFPFFNFSKSAVGDNTTLAAHQALNSTGAYTWGMGYDMGPDVECVVNHIYEDWPSSSACGSQNYTPHMKTNNEPLNSADDHPQDLETILNNWENLMRTGMRLGTPTSWDGKDYWNGTGFIYDEFLPAIDARGWRCDFVDAHGYWNEANFGYLESHWWGSGSHARPIWLSEWVWGSSWGKNGCFASGQTESTIVSTTSRILSTLNNSAHVERYFYWNSEADISKIYKDGALTSLGEAYAETDGGLGYNASYEFIPTVVLKNPYGLTGSIDGSNVSLSWSSPNGDMADNVKVQYKKASATSWSTLATQHPADKTSKNDAVNSYEGTLANAANYVWRVVETYESTEYPSLVFSTTVERNDALNYLPSNLGDYYFQFYSKEASSDLCWASYPDGNSETRVYYKAASTTDKYQLWTIEDNAANGGYSLRNLGEPATLVSSASSWNFVTRNTDYTVAAAKTAFAFTYYSSGNYWIVTNVAHGTYVGLWDADKSFSAGEVLAGNRANATSGNDSGDRIGIRAIPRATVNAALGIKTSETATTGASYYIYNADAGKFLVNGNSYGTRASLGESGLLWTLETGNNSAYVSFKNSTYSNPYLYVSGVDGMWVDGASSIGVVADSEAKDVTSTYLKNYNFASSTATTSTYIYGYGKDGSPYSLQSVTGWTSNIVASNSDGGYANSGLAGAVFSYGSSSALKGNGLTPPSSGPNGESGNCLGMVGVWGNGGYYYQSVTLPAGEYTLTYPVYAAQNTTAIVKNYFGFIADSGTEYLNSTTSFDKGWTTLTVSFTLSASTTGRICVGFTGSGGSGGAPHLFTDRVTLTRKGVSAATSGNTRDFKLTEGADGYYTIQVQPNNTDYGTSAMGTRYVGFVGDIAGTPYVLPCPKESYHSGVGDKWLLMSETSYNLYKTAVANASSYRQDMWPLVRAAKAAGLGDCEELAVYRSPESTVADIMSAQKSLKEKLLALEASEENPVDYSFLMSQADCGSSNFEGWTLDGSWGSNTTFFHNGDALLTNRFYESWVGGGNTLADRSLSQTLNLPAGKYQLSVDIIATQQGDADVTVEGVNLFLGDQKVSCHSANEVPETFTTEMFTVEDGTPVSLGLEIASTTGNWVAFDNFRLMYLGPAAPKDITGDGHWDIEDIKVVIDILLGRKSKDDYPNADQTGDGEVTLADLTKVINLANE